MDMVHGYESEHGWRVDGDEMNYIRTEILNKEVQHTPQSVSYLQTTHCAAYASLN